MFSPVWAVFGSTSARDLFNGMVMSRVDPPEPLYKGRHLTSARRLGFQTGVPDTEDYSTSTFSWQRVTGSSAAKVAQAGICRRP